MAGGDLAMRDKAAQDRGRLRGQEGEWGRWRRMLKSFEISNYKSLAHLKLELGRINVFIGENGAGKTTWSWATSWGNSGETAYAPYMTTV